MSATYSTDNIDFSGFQGVEDWEVLMKDPEDYDGCDEGFVTYKEWGLSPNPLEMTDPRDPTEDPTSPLAVHQEEATMETVEITKAVTVATMEIIVTETKRWKNPNRPTMGPRRRKVKQVKMSVGDFHAMCEAKEKTKAPTPAPAQTKRRKRRKDKGWTEVKVEKSAPINVSIKMPRGGPSKCTPPPVSKFVNTTLVLKNLPYDNTHEKALKSFFSSTCGEVRFVNVLRREDGKCRGMAFVRFKSREASDKGYRLNKFRYAGREITVDYARDRRE